MKKIALAAIAVGIMLAGCEKEKTCFECTKLTVFETLDATKFDYKFESPQIWEDCWREPNDMAQHEYGPRTVTETYAGRDTLFYNDLIIPLVDHQVKVTTSVKCDRK